MGTQLDVLPSQEPTTQQDIICPWLDLDDEFFQQELQDLENHLFDVATDPISSSSSSLPRPQGSPSFMLDDLYNNIINNAQQAGLQPNDQRPILPVQPCVEPDVCDTFLNGSEFGLISPTDHLSPDIHDQFCETMISGLLMKPLSGDVEISEPMITMAKETDEDGTDEDRPKQGTLNSKNMVSERNRRKRLSKQLLSLRSLVPNITKMDKRSVLVDALSYLRKIREETENLEKEIKEHQTSSGPKLSDLRETSQDPLSAGTLGIPRTASASVTYPKPKAQITEIDTEKIEDKRFIVKITCKGGVGVGSDVLRVFESMDFEITYAALQQLQPQVVLVTIFVRVKKQWKMTEQKLKYSITSMALRTGLSLSNPLFDQRHSGDE
ncbi:hypothetical protein AQUCO_02200304v1 [Aquilegia coerulea]|uniref:BHLH domain-containing protein n=1 Tax=Aquilegia coerulea TaxID=218851 RepID=A0A2G5DE23_AQUCA|nr:hypothetical protein AQUCO_02200304v1 [Aquilegia coerulea]